MYRTKPNGDHKAISKGTQSYLKQKEKEHISRGINSGKKTTDLSNKQPEQYKKLADSRKELKEAAEYILSVLDEMDYLDKSFLNEGITDFFKDAEIQDKINNNPSLVYKNSNLQSYISKIHDEITKIIKSKKIRNCKYYASNSKNPNSYNINAYAKDYPIKYHGTIGYTTNINSKIKHELIEEVNNHIDKVLDSGDKVNFSLQESMNESNSKFTKIDTSNDIYFNFTVYIGKSNLKKYVNK